MAQQPASAAKAAQPQKHSDFSKRSRALMRRETISAYLFLLPSLIFFVGFVLVPMGICLVYSLLDYSLAGVQGFSGLENYVRMFQDIFDLISFHNGSNKSKQYP